MKEDALKLCQAEGVVGTTRNGLVLLVDIVLKSVYCQFSQGSTGLSKIQSAEKVS